jgi:CheY-like chemotaxis protein
MPDKGQTAPDKRRDEFLATLAHELRGPLAPIMSAVTLLGFDQIDAATREASRAVIERQVQQLVRLVDDLLDVSRITAGKLELRRQLVPVSQVVRSAVETARPFLDQRKQPLHLTMPDDPVFIDGDPARLAQVFANLLNNAAKYSPIGDPISLEATTENGRAVIRVSDHGIGIPSAELEQVFEPFVQVDNNRGAQGGLGIGLTLARRLVEMHGGEIRAESAGLGHGSVFTVWLPTTNTDVAQPKLIEPVKGSRHRILVVDDNRDSVAALAALLSVLGHEVRTAFDAAGALAAVDSFRPNIALLDIGMPEMDGCELARRLRSDARLSGLLLVAVTGWGQPRDRARTREAGFDYHLVKPANIGQLQQILGSVA